MEKNIFCSIFNQNEEKNCITVREYLDTKSTINIPQFSSPKNEENANFFQKTVAKKFIKRKLEISQ